jgi:hypothetical protein
MMCDAKGVRGNRGRVMDGGVDAVREPLMMRRKRASVIITYIHTRPDPSDGSKTVQAGK